jgi:hypothetical protein
MDVKGWETPATFFPWEHVQGSIDRVDATVYRHAIRAAKDLFLGQARPCPGCGRDADELAWFCVISPEATWDEGTGRVGFLTLCNRCRLQVDFLVDRELTDLQAEEWVSDRTLP